jgi:tetratricopeptide (TPR) repeat protein
LSIRFEDEENLSLFTNPCHLTRRGCQHLHTENFESAIKHFEHAEELDAAFSSPAHYNHGIALLESSHDPKEQAKILAKAKDHFDKSSKLINDMKIPWIYIACLDGGDATTDLQSQMDTKLQLLEQHIGNYQKSAIAKIQVVHEYIMCIVCIWSRDFFLCLFTVNTLLNPLWELFFKPPKFRKFQFQLCHFRREYQLSPRHFAINKKTKMHKTSDPETGGLFLHL